MPLSTEDLAKVLARVERFWPHAPTLTPPQVADWRRTLSRFDVDTVGESVDFWAGAKPKFRPDLGEVLSKTQELEREKSAAARRLPSFVPPDPRDAAPVDVARAGIAQARAALPVKT